MTRRRRRGLDGEAIDVARHYRDHYPPTSSDRTYQWHPLNAISVAYRQQLERALVDVLRTYDRPLESVEMLDVGCGAGGVLRLLVELGCRPDRVHGIDLLEERVRRARHFNQEIGVLVADASVGLPLRDSAFDIVTQFVVFSSIPTPAARATVAAEMSRVVRPGGHILWYDMTTPTPGAVPSGIPLADVQGLFPGFSVVTCRPLHGRLLRRLARHPLLALLAEAAGTPRTNALVLLRDDRGGGRVSRGDPR
jgi:SAM-dependent methyltransferase